MRNVIKILSNISHQIQGGVLKKMQFIFSFILHYSTKKIFKKEVCKFPKMKLKLENSIYETRKNTVDFWTVSTMHEKEMTKYLMEKKNSGTFIDVGTHIGRYSIMMAKKGWEVHSFEPIIDNYNQLKKNIQINNVQDRISLYNIAVGEKEEERKIFYNKSKHGEASLVINEKLKKEGTNSTEKIRVNSIDNVFNKKIDGPIFLKIDVEGFEYPVLKGAVNFIKNNNPEISIEILGERKNETISLLKSLGYKHAFGELWINK